MKPDYTKPKSVIRFAPGDTYYSDHPGLPGEKPYKLHIVAVVDNDWVVFKWYGRHEQRWRYEIKKDWLLEMEIERTRNLS